MLTYSFDKRGGQSLYEYLYNCMKTDIINGVLSPNEKLPSKRAFASNHGISIVTVENTYGQLMAVELMGLCEGNLRMPLTELEPEHTEQLKKAMVDFGVKIQ